MKTKICIVSGSRAEYGLLYPLMKAIQEDEAFILLIIVTGMHLSPEFGLTYKEIENDGFQIHEKVEMLLSSDTDVGITKSTGLGMIGFADSFSRLKPDLVIILGDRFEAFAAATAAYLTKIPIAHLHGGETTEGATDEGLRHAITKMSYWHFTSTEAYRRRVIQLGENPEKVFNVGAIGIDNVVNLPLLSKQQLRESLSFDLEKPFLLVTFHPVTLENQTAAGQFRELLQALEALSELRIIFTKPNADADGRIIISMIDEFVRSNPDKYVSFTSLGQLRYLSLMKFATAVVGNSSSGIIEAPSFNIPTVNIGDRQKGRMAAESVVHVPPITKQIYNAIKIATTTDFKNTHNPYGKGTSTNQIMRTLKQNLSNLDLKKSFYDLN